MYVIFTKDEKLKLIFIEVNNVNVLIYLGV